MTWQLKYAEVDNHNGAKENNNKKLVRGAPFSFTVYWALGWLPLLLEYRVSFPERTLSILNILCPSLSFGTISRADLCPTSTSYYYNKPTLLCGFTIIHLFYLSNTPFWYELQYLFLSWSNGYILSA